MNEKRPLRPIIAPVLLAVILPDANKVSPREASPVLTTNCKLYQQQRCFVIRAICVYTSFNTPFALTMRIDLRTCPSCIERLIHQTVDMATNDVEFRGEALAGALHAMRGMMSTDRIPTQVAGEVQRVIRRVTGNRDPHRKWKDDEMRQARVLFEAVRPRYGSDIRSLLTLAILGNAPDFFKEVSEVREEMLRPVKYQVDHINKVAEFLEGARSTLFMADPAMDNMMCFVPAVNLCMKKVVLLADNAGECYFDQPLVKEMAQVMLVTYAVKSSPVQNDLTEEDLLISGIYNQMGATIMGTTDTAGTDMELVSPVFRAEFDSADLVIAKGMGNWETLSELPPSGKVFHLLVAKCSPVAESLGVPLGSYVAMLR
ncbi:MAG: ARMT1-like domain-containing protein [Dehalococcoidia bacterium]|nr:ARMT1-like domain-containing protein [Dehalococcoidia bacterium]